MLQKVRPDQVRLGMFIHALEGSWFDHPFWRAKFLLTDKRDLDSLRDSDLTAIVIDIEKGAGLPAPATPATEPATNAPSASRMPRGLLPARPRAQSRKAESPPLGPCTAAEEFARASKIVNRSKQAVKKMLGEARLGNAIKAGKLAPLVDEIAASAMRNASALVSIARLKNKDEYTYMHSVAVCALMINLARQLRLDEAVIHDIGMAGLLHDVGKMAVPDALLNKPGQLTDREFITVKTHPERGHALLVQSGGVPAIALDVALHHHERIDGTGYPHGLKRDAISRYARMAAICDVYDAVTSNRAYKEAWSPAEALASMIEFEGHFDPDILATFIRSIGIYPIGMLVRLRSDRLAVVIGEPEGDPTRPLLRAFYSVADRKRVTLVDLRPSTAPGGDQVIGPEKPEAWGFEPWEPVCSALIAGS